MQPQEKDIIKKIKLKTLDITRLSNVRHIPSCFSSIEILYTLYKKIANINLQNAKDEIRDRVLISKEHCYASRAVIMAELGLIPYEYLDTFIQDGGYLAHDLYNYVGDEKIQTMDVSCGSLGHGLGVGIGLAWDNKSNVYVLVGDGELQEGSCWEAIIFIAQNQMKNVTIIIDRNYIQIDDYTKNIIDTSSNLVKQMESFNFDVLECDGHNIDELEKVFKQKTNKPKCIIANTIKGKEVEFIRNKLDFTKSHGAPITDSDYAKVVEEINK